MCLRVAQRCAHACRALKRSAVRAAGRAAPKQLSYGPTCSGAQPTNLRARPIHADPRHARAANRLHPCLPYRLTIFLRSDGRTKVQGPRPSRSEALGPSPGVRGARSSEAPGPRSEVRGPRFEVSGARSEVRRRRLRVGLVVV